ncbi:hypothetical protein TRICI_004748 [Trichomonascus ciferrii]|uniref:DH domain-containing protein n=1 Tax=Trichomonascus ciferrii TaxID=44093 RepID=A0A642V5V7_9ASCO|nr:hypothetical protein TRICI_004748 [Trichomonascus ciferrii]
MGHRSEGERLKSRQSHHHHHHRHHRHHRHHHSTSGVSSRRAKPGSETIPVDRKKKSRKKRRALNKDLPPLPVEKEEQRQQHFNVEPSSNSSCTTILADTTMHANSLLDINYPAVPSQHTHQYSKSADHVDNRFYYNGDGSAVASPETPRSSVSSSASASYSHDAKYSHTSVTSTFSSVSSYKADSTTLPHSHDDQKRITKKFNLIRELVTTEQSFATDISVVLDIYLRKLLVNDKYSGFINKKDIAALKLNLADIISLSHNFYTDMLRCLPAYVLNTPSDGHLTDVETRIGQIMSDYIPKMEKSFKFYCDHNKVQMDTFYRIKSLASPVIDGWLNECLEESKEITTAWTLDALLIKPVQRLLKYPLLMSQLADCTDKSHPDHASIIKASDEIHACAERINSQEQQSPLTTEKDELLRLKDEVNADSDLESALFDFMHKHRNLKMLIKALRANSKDIQQHFTVNGSLAQSWFNWVDEASPEGSSSSHEVLERYKQYATFSSPLMGKATHSLVSKIESEVIQPLENVATLFNSTEELIAERQKYHSSYSKYVHSKSPLSYGEGSPSSTFNSNPEKRNSSNNNYNNSTSNNSSNNNNSNSALDAQAKNQADLFIKYHNSLKDGLPDLFKLSDQLVEACMEKFLRIQQRWFKYSADSLARVFDVKVSDIKDFANTERDPITEAYKDTSAEAAELISGLSICNPQSSCSEAENEGFDWVQSDTAESTKLSPLLSESASDASDQKSFQPSSPKKLKEDTPQHFFPARKKKEVRRKSSLLSLSSWQRTVRSKSSRLSTTSQ